MTFRIAVYLTFVCSAASLLDAGEHYDLGRPVIGAWQRYAWIVHNPVLKRGVLWAQECSQDGAVLYALELDSGKVIEEHDIWTVTAVKFNSVDRRVYATTDNQVLLRFHPREFKVEKTWQLRSPGTPLSGVAEDVGLLHISVASDGTSTALAIEVFIA